MEASDYGPRWGAGPLDVPPVPSEQEQRGAAEAIADAEAALAHQNSVTSQLDLQVVGAILNAHLRTVEGREALNKLQRETETAVRMRSDLDTPAGARDFQRFLIGKLRDIRAVVASGSLDDTSKSALMAAWTSLYNASKDGWGAPSEHQPVSRAADAIGPCCAGAEPAALPDRTEDPSLSSVPIDDPGLSAEGGPASISPTAPALPTAPAVLGVPNFGASPAGGTTSGTVPNWNTPAGFPLAGMFDRGRTDPTSWSLDERELKPEDRNPKNHTSPAESAGNNADDDKSTPEGAESSPTSPTTITLPDGETVTTSSPQVAEVIKAAVRGVSIADAFQRQGITIPAPGTAVTNPIEPSQVTPGDIGIYTDRHALALGGEKALLDGQIQHITALSGPNFLGWQHPPMSAIGTAPASAEPPIPTRPADTSR